ncbi:MAG: universal stress protein [Proteobacteria bacterium]|nr:universal stress protein [Pseudomonadota bacterium]MBU1389985.1 universal stress protein [Pseudomonadota bacterium]MBU1545064.1 universal stress protein [Pseudomonadota bacterium]MBU2430326.1 universal stress protein [Pseudomonadota bacterium]MBU2480891.1 universal stress protein [Pseudomonadota bacterium]
MKRFKNILYLNEPAVDQASTIARAVSLAVSNQADLTIIDVIPSQVVTAGIGLPPGGPVSFDLRAAVESEHRKAMESMVQSFKERLQIQLEVLVGKTYLEAIRAVLKNGYDLLIKPAENPTWTNRLFGSDDLHLLRKCPCPVWLMKAQEKTKYSSILAAVDFDLLAPQSSEHDFNRQILELAASVAISDFASLHILHAWEALAERMLLSRGGMSSEAIANHIGREQALHRDEIYRLVEKLRGWIGKDVYDYLSPRVHLPEGPAKKVIAPLSVQLKADLVVMGTVARTGISGLIIGNTAEAILDQLNCSVLAIKPVGFKTPVKLEE